MMNMLLGLVPAFMWGFQPIIMQKLGGKAENQQMGIVMGAFLFAVLVSLFKRPEIWTIPLIFSSFFGGMIWAYGQINQIRSFSLIGVSRAMPFSTGTQLIGTSLVGVLYFREWDTITKLLLGFGAMTIIIAGIAMTAYQEKKNTGSNEDFKKGFTILSLSTLGFVGYAALPRIVGINGWDALLPQASGMLIGSVFLCRLNGQAKLWDKKSFHHILTGFVFAVANLTMMLSNEVNGITVGFTLSQMNVVISTLGGLLILHEQKTPKEVKYVLTGLLLVVAGGVLIGASKGISG